MVLPFVAINQEYQTEAENEYVISGNDALLKCKIPSYVADLIQVVAWEDQNKNTFGTNQFVYGKMNYQESKLHPYPLLSVLTCLPHPMVQNNKFLKL